MANAIRFKYIDVPRQQSELARLKVIQGPDYGAVYVVVRPNAFIGRGDENDLVLSDLKTSRVHAELRLIQNNWIVEDKGSANGILYNGSATRQATLKVGDTITVGETTLEFITSDVGTQMLVAPPKTFEQLQVEQRRIAEIQGKNSAMGIGNFDPGVNPSGDSASKKNKTFLMIGAVLVAGFLIFGDSDKTQVNSNKKTDSVKQDLASFLPQTERNKSAETIFKDGFREYLSGNYSRARTQFETVLQIVPGHTLANLYLENCAMAINNSVKRHLEGGKKTLQSGKYKDAKGHFEMVMRLLYRDQANPSYIEAKDQLEKVNKELSDGGSS